jgi:2-phosphosulfolactate phosphatase
VDEAVGVARRIPGAVVSAEVDGLPVEGIPISNSPTQVAGLDWEGRTLVQRTSAGTQGATAAAARADRVIAASFVVAGATARFVAALEPPLVTLVPTGGEGRHAEDLACAELLEARLAGRPIEAGSLLDRVRADERYRLLAGGSVPGFPATDLDLALEVDRFDFVQEATVEEGLLRLRAAAPSSR